MADHKPGCEALGGYGQGAGPCGCGADAQTRPDIGPTDFGIPIELAERARNYARWCEAQAPAQPGRAVMQQALDALRLLDEAFCSDDYGTREGRNKGRTALIATRAAIAALSATMEKPNG